LIPDNKFEDVMKNKPKAFEEIEHIHKKTPTRLQSKQCDRCKFDLRELSMEAKKEELETNTKTNMIKKDGSTVVKTIKNMKVHRGGFDDVIGWSLEWS